MRPISALVLATFVVHRWDVLICRGTPCKHCRNDQLMLVVVFWHTGVGSDASPETLEGCGLGTFGLERFEDLAQRLVVLVGHLAIKTTLHIPYSDRQQPDELEEATLLHAQFKLGGLEAGSAVSEGVVCNGHTSVLIWTEEDRRIRIESG